MILSFTYQCKLFMLTIGLGLLSAFLYHVFYILCKTIRLNKIIKGIFDIIYWFIISLSLFLTMLKLNSGEVRPFAILGMSLGMIFYYSAIKPPMDRLMYTIFNFIKRAVLLIIDIILTPIRLVLYPIIKILTILSIFLKKHLKKYVKCEKIILYKLRQYFLGVTKLTTATVKKKHSKINILWALMMIITICIFAAALCYQYFLHLQLDTAKQEIEVQIAEAKAESAALTKQYENQDSPEFIEKVAREKLNMVYPSELVYINANSEEGKKLLNSIKRSSVKANSTENTTEDNSVSTRVE